jgi:hypothetical protein
MDERCDMARSFVNRPGVLDASAQDLTENRRFRLQDVDSDKLLERRGFQRCDPLVFDLVVDDGKRIEHEWVAGVDAGTTSCQLVDHVQNALGDG